MPSSREFSAGGIVDQKGSLLLVQVCNLKGDKVWTFPKGHLEPGETPEDAALREVHEETGWRCRSLGPVLTVGYKFTRQGRLVDKKVQWFLMEPVEEDGKPDAAEVLAVQWAPAEKAKAILKYRSDIELLELFLRKKK